MDLKGGLLRFITIMSVHLGNFLVKSVITDVRLVGGPTPDRGTVEIRQDNGTWETTCGINLGISDVIVICRQLGFRGASRAIPNTPYRQNSSPTRELICNGDEADLSECTLFTTSSCSSAGAATCHGDRYLGCFVDTPNDRVLPGDDIIDDPDMTISHCIQFCQDHITANYVYAGVEDGDECFCGGASDDYSRLGVGSDADCPAPCSGDSTESCGGLGSIAVFLIEPSTTTATSSLAPATPYVTASASKIHVNTGQPSTNTTEQDVSSSGTTAYPDQQKSDCSKETAGVLVVGVLLALVTLYAIIMTLMHLRLRRSSIAQKQSIDRKLDQELDPNTSLDVASMQQPAYEDIKSTRPKPTGPKSRPTEVKEITYENQAVAKMTAKVMNSKFKLNDNTETEYALPTAN